MRARLLAGILFVTSVTAATASTAQGPKRPPGTASPWLIADAPGSMHSVQFLTRHVGWAVGKGSETILYHTTTGGAVWDRVPLLDGGSGVNLIAIRFSDANHGWIIAPRKLFRTTNGGGTWEPVEAPPKLGAFTFRSLLVLGPDAIMIGCDAGRLYTTADAGRTWTLIELPKAQGKGAQEIADLAFAAPSTFFAVTNNGGLKSFGAVFRSTDGGHTWEPKATYGKLLEAISFSRDGRHGVAVGDNVGFWTDDGGDTWHPTTFAGRKLGVSFIDQQRVVAVGNRPGVLLSADGGQHWLPMATPSEVSGEFEYLSDISIVDPGWWFITAGSGGNKIIRYADPEYVDVIAASRVTMPGSFRFGGTTLPGGQYDVALVHSGVEHRLRVRRTDAPADTPPASASALVDLTYDVKDLPLDGDSTTSAGGDVISGMASPLRRRSVRLSLEPSATGVDVVMGGELAPPMNARLALAALGLGDGADVSLAGKASDVVSRAKQAARGVNPKDVAARLSAARVTPISVYHLTLRVPIELTK